MIGQDGRRLLQAELRTRLEECDFPSGELLDRYEATLATTGEATVYADLVMRKMGGKYPSLALIDRAHNVIAAIEQAEMRARP